MAHQQDPSSDHAKLARDIQNAVKAYAGFQTQLSRLGAPPWQNQWATLSAALKPVQENFVNLAAEWSVAQERLAKQAGVVQRQLTAIREWAGVLAEAQAALARELAEAAPRLRRALERADHLGQLGWTVTMSMLPRDVVRLSEMQQPAETDAYMLAWYEVFDSDLNRLEKRILNFKELKLFHVPISQCLIAYRRGEYAIAIPCLVAALERGVRNLGTA